MPFEPTLRLGSLHTFKELQKLKRMWALAHGNTDTFSAKGLEKSEEAGKITFHKTLGAHDMTVAQVLDEDGFTEFVQGYLKRTYGTEDSPIQPKFVKIIQKYLEDEYKWFAFDVIALDEKVHSLEPIEYRFKSDSVFYPLRISTLEQGDTKVQLAIFTPMGLKETDESMKRWLKKEPAVKCTIPELLTLGPDWYDFFGSSSELTLDEWKLTGDISRFTRDLKAR